MDRLINQNMKGRGSPAPTLDYTQISDMYNTYTIILNIIYTYQFKESVNKILDF